MNPTTSIFFRTSRPRPFSSAARISRAQFSPLVGLPLAGRPSRSPRSPRSQHDGSAFAKPTADKPAASAGPTYSHDAIQRAFVSRWQQSDFLARAQPQLTRYRE